MTTIDWPAFVLVLACALGGSLAAVCLFSVGVRLLATPPVQPAGEIDLADEHDYGEDDPATPPTARPTAATAGAVAAFVLAALVAVAGVVLIVH